MMTTVHCTSADLVPTRQPLERTSPVLTETTPFPVVDVHQLQAQPVPGGP